MTTPSGLGPGSLPHNPSGANDPLGLSARGLFGLTSSKSAEARAIQRAVDDNLGRITGKGEGEFAQAVGWVHNQTTGLWGYEVEYGRKQAATGDIERSTVSFTALQLGQGGPSVWGMTTSQSPASFLPVTNLAHVTSYAGSSDNRVRVQDIRERDAVLGDLVGGSLNPADTQARALARSRSGSSVGGMTAVDTRIQLGKASATTLSKWTDSAFLFDNLTFEQSTNYDIPGVTSGRTVTSDSLSPAQSRQVGEQLGDWARANNRSSTIYVNRHGAGHFFALDDAASPLELTPKSLQMNRLRPHETIYGADGAPLPYETAFGRFQSGPSIPGIVSGQYISGQRISVTQVSGQLIPEGGIYVSDADERRVGSQRTFTLAGDQTHLTSVGDLRGYSTPIGARSAIVNRVFDRDLNQTTFTVEETRPFYRAEQKGFGFKGVNVPLHVLKGSEDYLNPIFDRLQTTSVTNMQKPERLFEAMMTHFSLQTAAVQREAVEKAAQQIGWTGKLDEIATFETGRDGVERVAWTLRRDRENAANDSAVLLAQAAMNLLRDQGRVRTEMLQNVPVERWAVDSLRAQGITVRELPWNLPGVPRDQQPTTHFAGQVPVETVTMDAVARMHGTYLGASARLSFEELNMLRHQDRAQYDAIMGQINRIASGKARSTIGLNTAQEVVRATRVNLGTAAAIHPLALNAEDGESLEFRRKVGRMFLAERSALSQSDARLADEQLNRQAQVNVLRMLGEDRQYGARNLTVRTGGGEITLASFRAAADMLTPIEADEDETILARNYASSLMRLVFGLANSTDSDTPLPAGRVDELARMALGQQTEYSGKRGVQEQLLQVEVAALGQAASAYPGLPQGLAVLSQEDFGRLAGLMDAASLKTVMGGLNPEVEGGEAARRDALKQAFRDRFVAGGMLMFPAAAPSEHQFGQLMLSPEKFAEYGPAVDSYAQMLSTLGHTTYNSLAQIFASTKDTDADWVVNFVTHLLHSPVGGKSEQDQELARQLLRAGSEAAASQDKQKRDFSSISAGQWADLLDKRQHLDAAMQVENIAKSQMGPAYNQFTRGFLNAYLTAANSGAAAFDPERARALSLVAQSVYQGPLDMTPITGETAGPRPEPGTPAEKQAAAEAGLLKRSRQVAQAFMGRGTLFNQESREGAIPWAALKIKKPLRSEEEPVALNSTLPDNAREAVLAFARLGARTEDHDLRGATAQMFAPLSGASDPARAAAENRALVERVRRALPNLGGVHDAAFLKALGAASYEDWLLPIRAQDTGRMAPARIILQSQLAFQTTQDWQHRAANGETRAFEDFDPKALFPRMTGQDVAHWRTMAGIGRVAQSLQEGADLREGLEAFMAGRPVDDDQYGALQPFFAALGGVPADFGDRKREDALGLLRHKLGLRWSASAVEPGPSGQPVKLAGRGQLMSYPSSIPYALTALRQAHEGLRDFGDPEAAGQFYQALASVHLTVRGVDDKDQLLGMLGAAFPEVMAHLSRTEVTDRAGRASPELRGRKSPGSAIERGTAFEAEMEATVLGDTQAPKHVQRDALGTEAFTQVAGLQVRAGTPDLLYPSETDPAYFDAVGDLKLAGNRKIEQYLTGKEDAYFAQVLRYQSAPYDSLQPAADMLSFILLGSQQQYGGQADKEFIANQNVRLDQILQGEGAHREVRRRLLGRTGFLLDGGDEEEAASRFRSARAQAERRAFGLKKGGQQTGAGIAARIAAGRQQLIALPFDPKVVGPRLERELESLIPDALPAQMNQQVMMDYLAQAGRWQASAGAEEAPAAGVAPAVGAPAPGSPSMPVPAASITDVEEAVNYAAGELGQAYFRAYGQARSAGVYDGHEAMFSRDLLKSVDFGDVDLRQMVRMMNKVRSVHGKEMARQKAGLEPSRAYKEGVHYLGRLAQSGTIPGIGAMTSGGQILEMLSYDAQTTGSMAWEIQRRVQEEDQSRYQTRLGMQTERRQEAIRTSGQIANLVTNQPAAEVEKFAASLKSAMEAVGKFSSATTASAKVTQDHVKAMGRAAAVLSELDRTRTAIEAELGDGERGVNPARKAQLTQEWSDLVDRRAEVLNRYGLTEDQADTLKAQVEAVRSGAIEPGKYSLEDKEQLRDRAKVHYQRNKTEKAQFEAIAGEGAYDDYSALGGLLHGAEGASRGGAIGRIAEGIFDPKTMWMARMAMGMFINPAIRAAGQWEDTLTSRGAANLQTGGLSFADVETGTIGRIRRREAGREAFGLAYGEAVYGMYGSLLEAAPRDRTLSSLVASAGAIFAPAAFAGTMANNVLGKALPMAGPIGFGVAAAALTGLAALGNSNNWKSIGETFSGGTFTAEGVLGTAGASVLAAIEGLGGNRERANQLSFAPGANANARAASFGETSLDDLMNQTVTSNFWTTTLPESIWGALTGTNTSRIGDQFTPGDIRDMVQGEWYNRTKGRFGIGEQAAQNIFSAWAFYNPDDIRKMVPNEEITARLARLGIMGVDYNSYLNTAARSMNVSSADFGALATLFDQGTRYLEASPNAQLSVRQAEWAGDYLPDINQGRTRLGMSAMTDAEFTTLTRGQNPSAEFYTTYLTAQASYAMSGQTTGLATISAAREAYEKGRLAQAWRLIGMEPNDTASYLHRSIYGEAPVESLGEAGHVRKSAGSKPSDLSDSGKAGRGKRSSGPGQAPEPSQEELNFLLPPPVTTTSLGMMVDQMEANQTPLADAIRQMGAATDVGLMIEQQPAAVRAAVRGQNQNVPDPTNPLSYFGANNAYTNQRWVGDTRSDALAGFSQSPLRTAYARNIMALGDEQENQPGSGYVSPYLRNFMRMYDEQENRPGSGYRPEYVWSTYDSSAPEVSQAAQLYLRQAYAQEAMRMYDEQENRPGSGYTPVTSLLPPALVSFSHFRQRTAYTRNMMALADAQENRPGSGYVSPYYPNLGRTYDEQENPPGSGYAPGLAWWAYNSGTIPDVARSYLGHAFNQRMMALGDEQENRPGSGYTPVTPDPVNALYLETGRILEQQGTSDRELPPIRNSWDFLGGMISPDLFDGGTVTPGMTNEEKRQAALQTQRDQLSAIFRSIGSIVTFGERGINAVRTEAANRAVLEQERRQRVRQYAISQAALYDSSELENLSVYEPGTANVGPESLWYQRELRESAAQGRRDLLTELTGDDQAAGGFSTWDRQSRAIDTAFSLRPDMGSLRQNFGVAFALGNYTGSDLGKTLNLLDVEGVLSANGANFLSLGQSIAAAQGRPVTQERLGPALNDLLSRGATAMSLSMREGDNGASLARFIKEVLSESIVSGDVGSVNSALRGVNLPEVSVRGSRAVALAESPERMTAWQAAQGQRIGTAATGLPNVTGVLSNAASNLAFTNPLLSRQLTARSGFLQGVADQMVANGFSPMPMSTQFSMAQLTPTQFTQVQAIQSGNPYAISNHINAQGGTMDVGGYTLLPMLDMQTGANSFKYGINNVEYGALQNFASRQGLSGLGSQQMLAGGLVGLREAAYQNQVAQIGAGASHSVFMARMGLALQIGGGSLDSQGFVQGGSLDQYAAMLERRGYNVQTGNGMTLWQVQDATTKLQREKQQFGLDQAGRNMALAWEEFHLQGRQFYEKYGLNQEQFQYNTAYQRREMGIQRGIQLTQRQWQAQDIGFQQDVAEVGFGWQMEDFDRNIRYARGRDRLDLIRQRNRAVIQYSMQEGQREREKGRFEQSNEWADDLYQREKERFDQSITFQKREMEMQKKHFEEDRELQKKRLEMQQDAHNKEAGWLKEQWTLEDQQRLLERQNQLVSTDLTIKHTQAMAGLALAAAALQRQQELISLFWEEQGERLALFREKGELLGETLKNLVAERFPRLIEKLQLFAQLAQIIGDGSSLDVNPDDTPVNGGGSWHGGYVDAPYMAYDKRFDHGGYTGDGGKYEIAGVVHKGEYVVPQEGAMVIRGSDEETVKLLEEIANLLRDIKGMGPGRVSATIHTSAPAVSTNDLLNAAYRQVRQ